MEKDSKEKYQDKKDKQSGLVPSGQQGQGQNQPGQDPGQQLLIDQGSTSRRPSSAQSQLLDDSPRWGWAGSKFRVDTSAHQRDISFERRSTIVSSQSFDLSGYPGSTSARTSEAVEEVAEAQTDLTDANAATAGTAIPASKLSTSTASSRQSGGSARGERDRILETTKQERTPDAKPPKENVTSNFKQERRQTDEQTSTPISQRTTLDALFAAPVYGEPQVAPVSPQPQAGPVAPQPQPTPVSPQSQTGPVSPQSQGAPVSPQPPAGAYVSPHPQVQDGNATRWFEERKSEEKTVEPTPKEDAKRSTPQEIAGYYPTPIAPPATKPYEEQGKAEPTRTTTILPPKQEAQVDKQPTGPTSTPIAPIKQDQPQYSKESTGSPSVLPPKQAEAYHPPLQEIIKPSPVPVPPPMPLQDVQLPRESTKPSPAVPLPQQEVAQYPKESVKPIPVPPPKPEALLQKESVKPIPLPKLEELRPKESAKPMPVPPPKVEALQSRESAKPMQVPPPNLEAPNPKESAKPMPVPSPKQEVHHPKEPPQSIRPSSAPTRQESHHPKESPQSTSRPSPAPATKPLSWLQKLEAKRHTKGTATEPQRQKPKPLPDKKVFPEARKYEAYESTTDAPADTATDEEYYGTGGSKKKKRRKTRPASKNRSYDFDFDTDEQSLSSPGSSEYGSLDRIKSKSSLLSTAAEKFPTTLDDEMLFSLTRKEELVFRRSISEMRWEEEESFVEETDSSTEGNEAAAALWNRIGRPRGPEIPMISVNDKRISLSHLDPNPTEDGQAATGGSGGSEGVPQSYDNVFQGDNDSSSSPDSDPTQAMFELIEEANKQQKDMDNDFKKSHLKSKLWRRRLVIVIFLNLLMRFRSKFTTCNELIAPIVFTFMLIGGMVLNSDSSLQSVEAKHLNVSQEGGDPFEAVSIETIFNSFCSNAEYCGQRSDRHYFIVYTPRNNFTIDLMSRVLQYLEIEHDKHHDEHSHTYVSVEEGGGLISQLFGVNSSEEVEKYCQDHWEFADAEGEPSNDRRRLLRYPMGVIFSFDDGLRTAADMEKIESNEDMPRKLTYTIRTHYAEVANTVEGFTFSEHTSNNLSFRSSPYLHTGILGMQMAIDLAFAKKLIDRSVEEGDTHLKIGTKNPVYVSREAFYRSFVKEPALKQFEYPSYKGPTLRIKGWISLSMAIVLSYVTCDVVLAQTIVREQQMGSIELLKIHGMTTGMRWVAYLIVAGIVRSVTTFGMALTIHFFFASGAVADYSSPLFLWLFLWMHSCAVTCFIYFITTSIPKPELAGLVAVCIGFVTLLLPMHFFERGYLDRFSNMALAFLFPQWNLANGIYYYLRYELYEEGLDWYDFPVMIDGDTHRIIALPLSCNIFLYSTMLYLCLAVYLDHILPRNFSPKESWLYCFESFWRKPPSESSATRPIPRSQKPTVYEPSPREKKYGPRFRNVTLTHGSNKVTVLDNISLDIYEGEVTCIVGQTGSGKSDFLNAIAGVNSPSTGFVDVNGLQVHQYHDITNRYVSLCPQKQLLVATLSVEDHIRLCCMLHGASYGKAKTQAAFLLQMFGLTTMRRHSYLGLTISDRKKLLVAMALSKSPSILLLDNPIDQLDAEATFQFWKLLQELKPNRSIIVTCTKLEDAELYGDRIAILSKGKLLCYGTPAYIKLAYGIGGIINLRKMKDVEPDLSQITELMQKELRGAKVSLLETKGVSLHSDTLQFILPYGKFYGGLIERLEDNMEQLKISKLYMSQPSLWALFYQMATHTGIEQVLARREAHILKGADADDADAGFASALRRPLPEKTSNSSSIFNLGGVLVMKKIWYYRQKHRFFLVAYLAQIILVMQMVYFSRMFLASEPESLAKVISTQMYINNHVMVRSADNENTREGWEEAFRYVLREDDRALNVEILGYHDDIYSYLQAGTAHTLTHFRKQTNVAFGRSTAGHIGYYASNSIHSAPIAAHIMLQTFIYMVSPDRLRPHSTRFISYPMLQYEGYPAGSTQSNSATIMGIFLSVILALLSAPCIRMVTNEKNSRFKTIQRMAGVPSIIYWFCHGIGDVILYFLLSVICFVLIFFYDEVGWRQFHGERERFTLWYIFAGWLCWAAIPYTYFISQLLEIKGAGYGYYLLFHFTFGIVPKIITYQFMRINISGFGLVLRYMLYAFPPYSVTSACIHFFHVIGDEQWCNYADKHACSMYNNLTNSLSDGFSLSELDQNQLRYIQDKIEFNDTFRTCCESYCKMAGTCHSQRNFFFTAHDFAIPGLRHDMSALIANGFMYWILVILVEKHMIQSAYQFIATKLCGNLEKTVAERDLKTSDEPEDVKKEHLKVDYMVEIEGDVDSEVYLVQDLTKFYTYTKGLDHVFFSVPINAVTGVLGLPKSGKTTLLEILTSQRLQSAGYVYKNNDLLDSKSRKHLMRGVGYCPQTNFLLPYLTGAQMMTIMGRLRGLTSDECEQHVHIWLEEFGLKEVANRKCNTYRKGEERRLCCALAVIGNTDMIIYDEPTQFMDSLERYMFWNVVSRLPGLNRTILFASSDADEVQHQSAKVLVIDSGTLVAVGQLTEIFKNNNQGMLLTIRYGIQATKKYTDFQKNAKIDKLRDHIIQYLSPCALIDEQENLLIYHLKDLNLKLSQVYAVMEGAKVRFASLLEHFQVFEPSLDDIIILFHKARNKKQDRHSNPTEENAKEKANPPSDIPKAQNPTN